MKSIIKNKDYAAWLNEIKAKIRSAQIKAAIHVNTELLALYWDLGKMIEEKQSDSKWGDGIIDQLSKDLINDFPEIKGFSRANLFNIKKWYSFYSKPIKKVQQLVGQFKDDKEANNKVQQLVGLIPWGHHIQIITKCKDIDEALFYVKETVKNNWSRNILVLQIESNLYKRQGKAITNFKHTLPAPQSDLAIETMKNPYNLDFLMIGKDAQERELENAIINNLKRFLLELGKGFAYVGNQYNLTVEDDDYFLDLLFYNYHLRCFVVFELKIGEFKPEYAGKLNFYINTVDEQIKTKDHLPTIGILLCRTSNKTVIEYSLRGLDKPLGVSDYQLSKALPEKLESDLPTVEELEQELEKEVQEFQKPLDKKLNHLKTMLSSLKTDEYKEKRNPQNTERIFNKVLLKLKKDLLKESSEITNEFDEIEITIGEDNQGFYTEKDAKVHLKKHKQFNEFRLEIRFKALKKLGKKAFDYWKEIYITMHDYTYTIGMGRNQQEVIVEKLYHQLPDKQDFNLITDKFCETILDDITSRVERIKQENK